METVIILLALFVGVALVAWRAGRGSRQATPDPVGAQVGRSIPQADLVYQLNNFYTNVVTIPEDLDREPMFQDLVNLYANLADQELMALVEGSMTVPACAALTVLERRGGGPEVTVPILDLLPDVSSYSRAFSLRALHARASGPILGSVLARTDRSWKDGILLDAFRRFVRARLESEDPEAVCRGLDPSEESTEHLETLFRRLGPSCAAIADAWERRRQGGSGPGEEADSAGQGSATRPAIEHPELLQAVERLLRGLQPPQGHSTLLVGDPLVGKSTVLRALAGRLRALGWNVLERSATDLVAGQSFVGQLEGRVKEMVASLQGDRSVWIVPDFMDLVYAGRHSQSPIGVLEMLLPSIESGQLRMVGEVRTSTFDRLMQNVPRLRTAVECVRLRPLSEEATLELARRWRHSARPAGKDGAAGTPAAEEAVLRETLQLVKHYARDTALPGSLLQLLQRAHRRTLDTEGGTGTLLVADVLATLSEQTGIPATFLDEAHELDLAGLRKFFEARIMGQEEAIACLVDRIALLKAGLSDPSRPAGVLLFIGPTGTGKTAVAKALAEFLFGSGERMIRLDMSEFQSEESIVRLVGAGGSREQEFGQSLAQAIRSQPFSVVLLDEFEKAHPRIWDLFLQVFDDGRLTDRWGQTADFRHAIVILTSNLGAPPTRGPVIGFVPRGPAFSAAAVERALEGTFRPEFLNRIDRVVAFRPLHRAAMRQVLEKELRGSLRLRGLRTREWAVEWDETAVEFLLDRGFSPDLGARPLKRVIERHFLAPLAETIVTRSYPEGDQFLFVHAGTEGLVAEFVDPNLDHLPEMRAVTAPGEVAGGAGSAQGPTLRRLAREGGNRPEELAFLEFSYRALATAVEAPNWQDRKQAAFAAMNGGEFWASPERFTVLGLLEYLDRIEAGVRRAGAVLGRLAGSRPPANLVRRLAHQLYLLESAREGLRVGKHGEAFLLVESARDSQTPAEEHDAFAAELGGMYRRWAVARGMRLTVRSERPGDANEPYRLLLDISGFGALPILEPESGMHMIDSEEATRLRARAYVLVAPQPEGPAGVSPAEAEAAIRGAAEAEAARRVVVRRYRRDPSPLVRDAVRGWRTGRLDLVLGGQFDLLE